MIIKKASHSSGEIWKVEGEAPFHVGPKGGLSLVAAWHSLGPRSVARWLRVQSPLHCLAAFDPCSHPWVPAWSLEGFAPASFPSSGQGAAFVSWGTESATPHLVTFSQELESWGQPPGGLHTRYCWLSLLFPHSRPACCFLSLSVGSFCRDQSLIIFLKQYALSPGWSDSISLCSVCR